MKTKLIWSNDCNYPARSLLQTHTHTFFHFIYVKGGKGVMNLDSRKYELEKKQLYAVAPNTEHAFSSDAQSPLSTYEIKFEVTDELLFSKVVSLPHFIKIIPSEIEEIFASIYREYRFNLIYSEEILDLKLQELFNRLFRLLIANSDSGNADNGESPTDLNEFKSVINYIISKLDSNITLEALADSVCLEKNYFLKKFKRVVGKTPMQFVNEMRIERARDLLVFSDMNISQIAYASGFNCIHHFSNTFKKHFGVRPTEYKKTKKIE